VTLDAETLVVTDIQAFPWNRVFVNGIEIPQTSIVAVGLNGGDALALELPAGAYSIELRFEPDRIWRVLERLSWIVFLSWTATAMGVAIFNRRRTRVRAPPVVV
jgi:hypothetical protein